MMFPGKSSSTGSHLIVSSVTWKLTFQRIPVKVPNPVLTYFTPLGSLYTLWKHWDENKIWNCVKLRENKLDILFQYRKGLREGNELTHFIPIAFLYSPWKRQKTPDIGTAPLHNLPFKFIDSIFLDTVRGFLFYGTCSRSSTL